MSTFLTVLAVILAVLAITAVLLTGAACLDGCPVGAAACFAVAVTGVALLITWGVTAHDNRSGRCGDGTTRVEYRHGKTTEHVCERTPQ